MKLTFKLNLYYDINSKEYGFMKCEKKKILAWVKEHERELIIAGCSAFFVTVAIVGFKNKNIFCELVSLLRKSILFRYVFINSLLRHCLFVVNYK